MAIVHDLWEFIDMQSPRITVRTDDGNDAVAYEKLPGDAYCHALIGKHGELRVHSSKPNDDANIESQNLPKEVYTVLAVYNQRVWRSYHPDAQDEAIEE